MGYLVLVRHGESRWNLDNKFTGWVDVPLSEAGINEAIIASNQLKEINFDVAFTSKLQRAQETLLLILAKQNKTGIFLHNKGKKKIWSKYLTFSKSEIPIFSSDKINERYYGYLQGMNKNFVRREFGKDQVFIWRRSFDIRPPGGESLKDVCKRAIPYFEKTIMKEVKSGKNIIVSAHGNSLRAIIKHIDGISDKDISELELPTGKPIIYKWINGKLNVENHSHSYNRKISWNQSK